MGIASNVYTRSHGGLYTPDRRIIPPPSVIDRWKVPELPDVGRYPQKAAVAFGTKTFGNGTGTSATPTEPASAALNDIFFMWIVVAGTNSSFVAPSGWTNLYTLPATSADVWLYWIRRGSGAPSFAISWTTSSYYEWSVTRWTGCITTGNPYSASANNARTTRNPANPNCPSVSTGVANTIVVAFGMGWHGCAAGGWGAPTSYTIREANSVTNDLCIASRAIAVAGAEDPGAFTNSDTSGTPTDEVAEITVALQPPAAGGGPITHGGSIARGSLVRGGKVAA